MPLFRFKKDKFKDLLKVVEFMDENKIEYEVVTDITVAVGATPDEIAGVSQAPVAAPVAQAVPTAAPEPAAPPKPSAEVLARMEEAGVSLPEPPKDPADILWRPAQHLNADQSQIIVCQDRKCKEIGHLGGMLMA